MDQDTVVTTYASLNNLAKNNPLFLEDFSVVILDEAHHALGENTSKIIKQVSEETLVLGFTATPDYTEMKKLDSVLEKSIHSINLEEALREGLVATLVPVAIKTNNKISNIELNEFGEYVQDSMSDLMYDTTRNKIIIKLIQELKNHGIQAVVSCIPGQEFFHPKFLAELARKNNIKAQSITSDTPKLERAEMQKRFENGEIDALFYINVLSEGWDSQAARALINARPTRSKLLATQRIGRILRNKPENNYGLVIELLDKYNQLDAPPVLASDVLGYRLN
jgi:superfamily II DNA or RNA helicase